MGLATLAKIRLVETYLSPLYARRLTGLPASRLRGYVRLGILSQYRTEGGHRRFALSELRALLARIRKPR